MDKLIADAYAGGHVNVRDFLDYLSTLNDSGAREGEAPAETHGAVRLMTIHKAKGLEFPVVVLADTGHADRARSNLAYLLPETGLAVKLEPEPMLYRLAQWQDGLQEDAESLRILYVAMTRAKEKLIISGHLTSRSGGEWLDEIVAAIRVDTDSLLQQPGRPLCTQTASGHPIRAIAHLTIEENDTELSDIDAIENPSCEGIPLFQPLSTTKSTFDAFDESDERRLWRATGEEIHLPPGVIGQLVHKAIELWLFPGDSRLVTLLETAVLSAGLASSQQRVEAIRRTMELLGRLRSHPIWEDINSAESRYHEIPYLRMVGERSETGYIDLLYKHSHGWHVVDFKTDSIRTTEERDEILFSYKQQMDRYFKAVFELLKQKAEVQVCFLNDHENVSIVTV